MEAEQKTTPIIAHPPGRKPLDIHNPPLGISSEAIIIYGLHEGNIEEGKQLSAELARNEAIKEAKKVAGEAAVTAFIGALAKRGYRLKKGAEIPPSACIKSDVPPHIQEAEKRLAALIRDAKECLKDGWSKAEVSRRVAEGMEL